MPRDPALAVRWLTKAAEDDQVQAIRALAQCYRDGVGVAADPVAADRLLKKLPKEERTGAPAASASTTPPPASQGGGLFSRLFGRR